MIRFNVESFLLFKIFWAKPTDVYVKIEVSAPIKAKKLIKDKKAFTLNLGYSWVLTWNDAKLFRSPPKCFGLVRLG